jgi:hypothetical protein
MVGSLGVDAVSDCCSWAVPSIWVLSSGGRGRWRVLVCAGCVLNLARGAMGCGWVCVGCVFGMVVGMVSGREVVGCWLPGVVVLVGVGVVGATRLVAAVASLAELWLVANQVGLAADVFGGVVWLVVGFGGSGAAGRMWSAGGVFGRVGCVGDGLGGFGVVGGK